MSKNKKSKFRSFLGKRQFRYGWYATLITVLVIAVVVVVNMAAGAIEDRFALSIDMSPNSITSLSDQTLEVLGQVDEEVHIYTVYQNSTQTESRIQLEAIINRYCAQNGNIKTENIDPVSNPQKINSYTDSTSLSEGAVIMTNADESRVRVINASDFYQYYQNSSTGSYSASFTQAESRLTAGLLYVISDDTPKVYFLTGHNELSSDNCSVLKEQLSNENYEVSDLTLGAADAPELAAGDTILVLSPTMDLTDEEYETMRDWLESGGRLMFAANYNVDFEQLPNFSKLLALYNLSFKDGIAVEDQETSSSWLGRPDWIVPTIEEHDATESLTDGRLIMPSARPVQYPEMPLSGIQYKSMLTTSDNAYVKSSLDANTDLFTRTDEDETGSQILAMSAMRQNIDDPTQDVRIVLVGSSDIFADTTLITSTNNIDFILSAIQWMVNRDVNVSVRAKTAQDTVLRIPDAGTFWTLAAVCIIAIPVLVLVGGVAVWLRRRHL